MFELAGLLRTRGRYDEAERLLDGALEIHEERGDSVAVVATLHALGSLRAEAGAS